MERQGSPPPYTTSTISPPPSSAADGNDASAPPSRETGAQSQYLLHLPEMSRSTYTPVGSTRQTQIDSVRESVQRSPGGQTGAPPEYPNNTVRIIPRTSNARSTNPNIVIVPRRPGETTPSLIHQPGTSRSSFSTSQNVVIIPRQSAQPALTSGQQSGVSIPITPRENALVTRPAGQSSLSPIQESGLTSSVTDDEPPAFVDDEPLPSFAEAMAESRRRFPKEIGFYTVMNSFSDMVIAPRDDSNHLYYISTHNRLSNKRSVILHSGRFVYSPPLATADFPRFTSTIDIELMATPLNSLEHHHLEKSASGRVFSITLPGSDVTEHFEWKRSQGEEVAILHGRSHGEKLVRVNTGEIVAAWTAPLMVTKKGGISFLGNRKALGEKFEVMAVICMLGIMGKDHGGSKAGNNNHNNAGSVGIGS